MRTFALLFDDPLNFPAERCRASLGYVVGSGAEGEPGWAAARANGRAARPCGLRGWGGGARGREGPLGLATPGWSPLFSSLPQLGPPREGNPGPRPEHHPITRRRP